MRVVRPVRTKNQWKGYLYPGAVGIGIHSIIECENLICVSQKPCSCIGLQAKTKAYGQEQVPTSSGGKAGQQQPDKTDGPDNHKKQGRPTHELGAGQIDRAGTPPTAGDEGGGPAKHLTSRTDTHAGNEQETGNVKGRTANS